MSILLDNVFTPRQAWTRIRGAIVADGLAQDCKPLIDWIRVAITAHQANQNSNLDVAVPASQNLSNLSEANRFQAFRTHIIDLYHPNLRTNLVTQGAVNIATSTEALADQTRLQREADDLRRSRDTNKGLSDLFPVGLQKSMRWCQVHQESQPPDIYQRAYNVKKGKRHNLLQDAVDKAM